MHGENRIMEREEYLAAVNSCLTKRYAINLEDTGYSDDEWLSRFGDLDVEEAVRMYADKYDLVSKGYGSI